MVKSRYSQAFREQALRKVLGRGDRTVQAVADELNMNCLTLRTWIKMSKQKKSMAASDKERSPRGWSAEERLNALMDTHPLAEEALNAWCRQHGIYAHHLAQWREEFCGGGETTSTKAWRVLKDENQKLTKELARKEKALAEAGALLVLQKKFQALWEAEEK